MNEQFFLWQMSVLVLLWPVLFRRFTIESSFFSGKLYISQALPGLPSTITVTAKCETEVVQSDREAPFVDGWKMEQYNIADGYNMLTCLDPFLELGHASFRQRVFL